MMSSLFRHKRNWLTDKEYRFVYNRVPRCCVDLLLFTRGGFILSKRDIAPHKGLWHFIGGRLYRGEFMRDAIRRIVKAEAGVTIGTSRHLGYSETFNNEGPHFHDVSIIFAAKIKSGVIRGSEQAQTVRAYKKIPRGMIPEHRIFLKKHWSIVKKLLKDFS